MSRVGDKIRETRSKKGLSIKALSKKLGVSEKFLNDVESGRKIMTESLINKCSDVLGVNINDITLNFTEDEKIKEKKFDKPKKNEKVEVWQDAFKSILKSVPVYDYSLNNILDSRKMAVVDNKIEGHNQDKVLFLKVEDTDMIGFRIQKGDIAFGYKINEIENNSICFLEYKKGRHIRKVKKLNNTKVLLLSQGAGLITETVNIKEIKPLAKIEKLEIIL